MALGKLGGKGGMGRLGSLAGAGSPYTPEANLLFAAMTTPPNNARKTLINNVIVSLKASGVWALLDVMYMFAAADAQAARLNWKDPASFVATTVNSPSFAPDRGFTGDGSSSYINSNYTPSANAINMTQNSAHYGGWSLTAIGAANGVQRILGNTSGTGGRSIIAPWSAGNIANVIVNDLTGSTTQSNATSQGDFLAIRSAATARQVYRNGTSLGSDVQASTGLPPSLLVFGRDNSNYGTLQIAAGSAGASMTAGQAASFYSARQTYLQAIGAV
jgi:hypothetical protein